MKACIFCPNPRTRKRGEHVWDDWLNREAGREIRDPSTTSHFGREGKLIRSHPSIRMDVTLPVVCDTCNHTWMSELSSLAKERLEPIIRRERHRDFSDVDTLVITSFAFLKSAVLDWSATDRGRKPLLARATCVRFRESLASPSSQVTDVALPHGLQVWIARYRRTHLMEAQAFTEEMSGVRHFKGYKILVVTYLVGSFIFQLTYPRWIKATRKRPAPPFFEILGDDFAVPIWPGVRFAYWPPFAHVDSRTLEAFKKRFTRVRIT